MSNDLLRGAWKHGPFSCDVPKTCLATYCCPCIVYGMTEHALGHNFLAGCLLACCVPFYPTITQRQAVAKKHGIESNCAEDVALTCCCGFCVTMQSANQMGEAADIRRVSLSAVPPCVLRCVQFTC